MLTKEEIEQRRQIKMISIKDLVPADHLLRKIENARNIFCRRLEMDIKFNKVSDFDRGIFFNLLSRAYSFDKKYERECGEKWKRENDDFFFDNLQIADKVCFITTLDGEAIGLAMYDPRNMPEYAIIGHNCIVPKHKGKGYGILQLQELINRITENDVKKIFVSTNDDLIPAQRMYERVGFVKLDNSTLETWQIEQKCDVYYCMEICNR